MAQSGVGGSDAGRSAEDSGISEFARGFFEFEAPAPLQLDAIAFWLAEEPRDFSWRDTRRSIVRCGRFVRLLHHAQWPCPILLRSAAAMAVVRVRGPLFSDRADQPSTAGLPSEALDPPRRRSGRPAWRVLTSNQDCYWSGALRTLGLSRSQASCARARVQPVPWLLFESR
jgi:hypothetical protein